MNKSPEIVCYIYPPMWQTLNSNIFTKKHEFTNAALQEDGENTFGGPNGKQGRHD